MNDEIIWSIETAGIDGFDKPIKTVKDWEFLAYDLGYYLQDIAFELFEDYDKIDKKELIKAFKEGLKG